MNRHGRALGLVLLLAALLAAPLSAQEPWETRIDKEGLLVETRDVQGSDYKAFRASIDIAAPMESVLARLQDIDSYVDWFPDVIEARRLEGGGPNWRQYVRSDLPWPVKDRDAIYVQHLVRDETQIRIEVGVDPDALPEKGDAVRVRAAGGAWLLTAVDGGTRVNWEFHLEPAGRIPSGIANSRVVDTPKRALLALRDHFGGFDGSATAD